MGVETILRASRLTATLAMTDDSQLSFNLPSVSRKKVTAAFDGGRLSSDSGVMLLALADRRRAVVDTLAALIADHRDPSHITHTVADVLRGYAIAIYIAACAVVSLVAAALMPDYTGKDISREYDER
jgi:hypothetical protein